jgi:hypothetical protein
MFNFDDAPTITRYGGAAIPLMPADASPLHDNAVQTSRGPAGLSADNPTLWLVAILAATCGLVGFSTSGHIGPVSASLKAG